MTIGRIPSVEGGIQPTIVDAKGDLIAATAADTVNRLAVGDNDQVLVADSAATTGLAWKSVATPFAAGKNKIINGDFGIWQRGTSITYTAGSFLYGADRFIFWHNGSTAGTNTFSQQTFTPGTAPVAGYEGTFFGRLTTTTLGSGQTVIDLHQRIEDVRTFAGQTVTVSFWAKSSGTQGISGFISQAFGSGGSTTVDNTLTISGNLSSSWQRFTTTITLPSISGKTIGTSNYLVLILRIASPTAGQTIDFWGVQVEAGSVATPFTTATGTIQGELAACARYYQKSYNLGTAPGTDTNDGLNYSAWSAAATTTGYLSYEIVYPVRMRTAATVVTYDVADASGKVSRVTPGGSDQNGLTPGTAFGNEARILIQSASGNSHAGLALHWTASAEL